LPIIIPPPSGLPGEMPDRLGLPLPDSGVGATGTCIFPERS